MTGEIETTSGVGLIGAGVVALLKAVDIVGTDLTTGVAGLAVGAGLIVAGALLTKYGILKATVAKVAQTFKVKAK